jgi:chromosomal replication initiator protein
MNPWDQIRHELQNKIGADAYQNWLTGTAFLGMDTDTLVVSVPDIETRTWLETEFSKLVEQSIRQLALPVRNVRYEPEPVRGARNQAMAALETGEMELADSLLNPKFTFDYVRGGRLQPVRTRSRPFGSHQSRRAAITRCLFTAAWVWGRLT